MNPLVSTFTTSAVHVWEAVTVLAAAVVFRDMPEQALKTQRATLDGHTQRDIGVEPGSITWLH